LVPFQSSAAAANAWAYCGAVHAISEVSSSKVHIELKRWPIQAQAGSRRTTLRF
jgi:hypothetical protein